MRVLLFVLVAMLVLTTKARSLTEKRVVAGNRFWQNFGTPGDLQRNRGGFFGPGIGKGNGTCCY